MNVNLSSVKTFFQKAALISQIITTTQPNNIKTKQLF